MTCGIIGSGCMTTSSTTWSIHTHGGPCVGLSRSSFPSPAWWGHRGVLWVIKWSLSNENRRLIPWRETREKKEKEIIIILLKKFRKGDCHLEAKNHLEGCNPSTLQQFFANTIKLSIISCIVPFQHNFSLKCPKPVAQRSFSHMCQNYAQSILFRLRCSNLYLEWGPSSVCWNALLQ